MDQLLEKISELLFETKSNQERDILCYLQNHLSQVPFMTLATIADNNYCSPTSVSRIIKKLDYDNFKEFQITIKNYYNIKNEQTFDVNKDFVHEFINTNCIYVYGKGASYLSAIHLSRQLIKAGYDCSLIYEQDLLYSIHNKTIVFISNSGQTNSVIDIVEDIREINNCKILAITQIDSTLAKLSHHSLLHNINIQDRREDQTHLINTIDNLISYLKRHHHKPL